jgi:hypothetical protein
MRATKVADAREHTGNASADRSQRLAQEVNQAIRQCPLISGVRLDAQVITTASKTYDHGLGRAPVGVLVLKSVTATAMGFPAAQPLDTARQVNLTASAASAAADLWFF